ncbi:MAG: alcohol dehydrogenase catalytic domain-containing protein [Candidatus Limnocylindrales bacterium]|jgi:L-iditol 2-dehydrogenase
MRAMLLSAPLTLEIVEQPDPVIENDDDVVVRVRAASVCGSDTHGYDGRNGRRVPPLVMGHEASGEVVAVGSAVTAVKPGDRVFVMPMHWCGTCDACAHGQFDLCPERKVYGGDLPGAFAELFRVSERTAIPIPDEVTFRQAALIEPLAVVVKGLARAKFDAGDSAAVIGGGPIGLIATAVLALHRPHHLVVMEPLPARREIARQMGATLVLDPTQDGAMDAFMQATNGLGADLTVEAVGSTASVRSAVDATRAGGQLIWLGNVGRIVEIDEFKVVWNQLTIHASVGVSRRSVERAIELIADGAVPVENILSLDVPLDEAVDAFHRTARDPDIVKTIIRP